MNKKYFLGSIMLLLVQGASAQIEIDSIEELQLIGNDSDYPSTATYVLTQDIDASETSNAAGVFGSDGFDSIGSFFSPFTGTFDGQGYIISDYYSANGGIFERVSNGGTIRNIFMSNYDIDTTGQNIGGVVNELAGGTVENCHVTGVLVSTSNNIGGLIGTLRTSSGHNLVTSSTVTGNITGDAVVGGLIGGSSEGTINWCSTAGSLTDTDNDYAGGLVGRMLESMVSECSSSMNINGGFGAGGLVGGCLSNSVIERSYATGNVSGGDAGGLFGQASLITASDSYSSGTVTGSFRPGGFAAQAGSSDFINCYSISNVPTGSNPGGFIGMIDASTPISGCYWDTETSGQSDGFGSNTGSSTVDGRTTAEMTFPYDDSTSMTSAYVGWDFVNVWADDTSGTVNGGYPYLQWQTDPTREVTVMYAADSNGSITGDINQTFRRGMNSTTVEAVPNSGFEFVQWSDSSTENPRKDRLVDSDISVTAQFATISNVGDWEILNKD